MADFSFSDDRELQALSALALDEPEKSEHWENLVRAAESQEGGLNRNSSPQAIAATRETYDRFLTRYPLFFGYWKKYADLEFAIGGTEAAEMVYERGVASIGTSVDLWANYCAFKVETSHEAEVIREASFGVWWIRCTIAHHLTALHLLNPLPRQQFTTLFVEALPSPVLLRKPGPDAFVWLDLSVNYILFERGAESVGLDFLAHPFWDKYLEFEERVESQANIFGILGRIIQIPLHQYARYFERYQNLAQQRPVAELASEEVLTRFRDEINREAGPKPLSETEVERELRSRLHAHHISIFQKTQAETTKRWTYEQEVKRPYFHVTELDDAQLTNWHKYLDFEEAESDNHERIKFLYERCLVTTANYDEFWFRYARWIMKHNGPSKETREEELRNVFRRACSSYVPISQPSIRIYYARFEESVGKPDTAIAIHESILMNLPGHLETIMSLVAVHRRRDGVTSAMEVINEYANSQECSSNTRGALTAEIARLTWKVKGDVDEARAIFAKRHEWFPGCRQFWVNWLFFELEQPTSASTEPTQYARIKAVYQKIREKSQLSPAVIKDLSAHYFVYLQQRGGKDAMKEYMALDVDINGPPSVALGMNGRSMAEEGGGADDQRLIQENGHPGLETHETILRQLGLFNQPPSDSTHG